MVGSCSPHSCSRRAAGTGILGRGPQGWGRQLPCQASPERTGGGQPPPAERGRRARDAQRLHPGRRRGRCRDAARPAEALAGPARCQPPGSPPRPPCSPPRSPPGPMPTSRGLASALGHLLASPALGPHVGVVVTDLASGHGAFRPGRHHPGHPGLQRQGGHRGGGAERARSRRALHHPGRPRCRAGLDRPGGRRGPDPGGGPARRPRTTRSRRTWRRWRPRRRAGCAPTASGRSGWAMTPRCSPARSPHRAGPPATSPPAT